MIQDTDMNADFHNGPNLGLEPTTPMKAGAAPQPAEPVSKTDWNNELSSWSDEDFIRILHERPDLANRLRKILAEPVKVPSDADIDAVFNDMPDGANGWLKSWGYRQFARALLSRYGRQQAESAEPAAQAPADDARDAERYRLLRRKVCIECGEFHIRNLDPLYIGPDAAAKLDATIDAAIAQQRTNGDHHE